MFDAITQVAFLPENPFETGLNTLKSISLLGPQVGKLGGALGDASQVTDDDGQPLPTAWVINNIKAIGDLVDQLAEGFGALPTDGTLSADDPNLTMLLASKSALDQLLQKFYDSPDADQLHQASSNMDDYLAAVSARNGTILQYNAELAQYRQTWAQAKAATAAEANALDLKTAATTLGLANVGNLIDANLGQARLSCIEALYMTSRAWSRWALQPEDSSMTSNSTTLGTSTRPSREAGPGRPDHERGRGDREGLARQPRAARRRRGTTRWIRKASSGPCAPPTGLTSSAVCAIQQGRRLRHASRTTPAAGGSFREHAQHPSTRCALLAPRRQILHEPRLGASSHCGDETFVVNAQPNPEDP